LKLITFTPEGPAGGERAGFLISDGTEVLDLTAGAAGLPAPASERDWHDLASACLAQARALHHEVVRDATRLDELRAAGVVLPRGAVRLLAPVPRPRKFICIGLNYRDHAAEQGAEVPESPIVFSKFATAVTGPGAPVRIPLGSAKVDYEAELGVVIGREAFRVTEDEAREHVLGYTCVNDVSARDFQFADGQWQRGKSCDTFGPMGESIVTTDEIPDPHRLRISFRLNGETLQDSSTDQLVFGVFALVSFLSQTITLQPGDVIATGTPPGVGFARKPPIFVQPGDTMEVEIEGLGVLMNPVIGSQA